MWKKYLDKYFSTEYYKLLFKRHMSLCIIPLAVYLCLLILIGILGFDAEVLVLFLIPYATAIVPLTALVLFKPYTKKGDTSYLLSIPLTRTQIFLTTYLVGLTVIELTLMIMVPIVFIGMMLSECIKALIMFIVLGIVYYTFACLGCMMATQSITQFLIMGVICFGPIALYLLNKLSVSILTLGNYTTPINDSLVMIVCPLVSALEFMSYEGGWPYWWAHILMVVGSLVLSVYLMKRRPIEQTEQGTLFKNADRLIVKPVIYLNIVFVIFNACLYLILNHNHYYDMSYYLSVLVLLLGSSLLVSFLIAIWTSKNLKSLFQPKELLYQMGLIMLACGFLFVPLWQSEQARTKILEDRYNLVKFSMPNMFYRSYSTTMDKETLAFHLEEMTEDRSSFTNQVLESNVGNISINYRQSYYFDMTQLSEPLSNLIEKVLLGSREGFLDNSSPKLALIQTDKGVYLKSTLLKAIEATYQDTMPEHFIENIEKMDESEWDVLQENLSLNAFSDFSKEFYPLTLSHLDYGAWLKTVEANCLADFSITEWNQIVSSARDFSKGTIVSKHLQPLLKVIDIVKYYDPEYWTIIEADEDEIKLRYDIYVDVMENYETDEMTLFAGTSIGLVIEVSLNKVNGEWIPTFEGVYY